MLSIITLFILFFSLLKYLMLILMYLSLFNSLFIKLCVILLQIFLIQYIYLRPYKKRLKLSYIRYQKNNIYTDYKISNVFHLVLNSLVILSFITVFIILILFLRIKNRFKILDIDVVYQKIFALFNNISIIEIFINMGILINICVLYILLMINLMKFIKKVGMRLYLFCFYYFYIVTYNQTKFNILYFLWDNLTINYHISNVTFKLTNLSESLFERFIFSHLKGLQFIIHKVILIIVIIYDIKYNNMILTHMYRILPYVFIYEIWVKLSIFLTSIHFPYDEVVTKLLYGEVIELECDKECLYLDGEPYEKTTIKEITIEYVQNNFVYKHAIVNEPIKEGLDFMLDFWKRLIFDKIINKYESIDILFFIIFLLFAYILHL